MSFVIRMPHRCTCNVCVAGGIGVTLLGYRAGKGWHGTCEPQYVVYFHTRAYAEEQFQKQFCRSPKPEDIGTSDDVDIWLMEEMIT